MELSFGCGVTLHTDNNLPYGSGAGFMYCKGVIIRETEKWFIVEYEGQQGSYPKEIGLIPRASRITEIIGHPPHLEHWLRGIVEGTGDGQWIAKHTSLGSELVWMRDFGTKKFQNKYLVVRDTEKFYEAFCEIVGLK